MVRAAAYWPIVPAMKKIGVPVQRHMAAAQVPDEAMSSQELLLPERPVWDLFDRVREIEGVDDIGFQVGASHGVLDVPGLAHPLSGHVSLLQLMKAFCNQLKSHSNCWTYWINRVPEGVLLCRRGSPIDVGKWPVEQYAIAYLTDLVRMAAKPDWFPSRIWLQADAAEVRSERDWLGDSQVQFSQVQTAIFIPTEYLALAVRYDKPTGAPMRMRPIPVCMIENLRAIIRAYVNQPGFGLDDLAELTGTHSRSLQRYLARNGTTFRRVLSETRFELARELLFDPNALVSDVASDLGYRSLSAFNKEFRKWAGVSPRVFRAGL